MSCQNSYFDVKNVSSFVAAVGLLPDYVVEICYFSEEELSKMDLDIIEKVPIKNKHQARQDFVQMAIRYGCRDFHSLNYFPCTHEERIKLVKEFSEKLKESNYIASAYIVGSVAENRDNDFSDIDVLVIRKTCPGRSKCSAIGLELYYPLDIWCYSIEEFIALTKKNPETLANAIQIIL